MTLPLPCITEVRNAYEGHDRDALERVLVRISATLIACALPGAVRQMTLETLLQHRDNLHVQLAAVDDEVKRRDLVRHGIAIMPRVTQDDGASIDPSCWKKP